MTRAVLGLALCVLGFLIPPAAGRLFVAVLEFLQ